MRVKGGGGRTLYRVLILSIICNGIMGLALAGPILPRDTSTSIDLNDSQGLTLGFYERLATIISASSSITGSTSSTHLISTTIPATLTAPTPVKSSPAAAAPSGVTDDPKDLVTTSVISATSTAIATNAPNAVFPECHPGEMGDFPPFCEPQNGSTKWVGASYYVTWDVAEFSQNATIRIELDYTNATGSAPQHAWSSPPTAKNLGYVIMIMDAAWLQGQSFNNLSLTLVSLDPTVNKPAPKLPGPIIGLMNEPIQHYQPSPHSELNKLGLEVGIPVGLGTFLLIMGGLWFGMRKTRRIELGNVMRRRKGYGVGKSRRQRLGKQADIQLREAALRPESPGFRDEPLHDVEVPQGFAGHAREASLGSLVSSTAGDSFSRPQGNLFREEMERQRTRH